ncbi:MAG: hypothetical protein MUO23_08625 [Anaerolineales bacterium]|nr:hypothetical protein [Anaerolineales bacterium]
MAADADLRRQLADLERRVRVLEGKPSKPRTQKDSRKLESLPQHILSLREAGFFVQPRIATDVHKKLLPTYHCEVDRVNMALYRLASRKELRKASKVIGGKRMQAYVW